MRTGAYIVVLLLGVACVILTTSLILIARTNQRLQIQLQARQQALSQGILGQQAQQISSGVLQDMAGAAAEDAEIRRLLEKYGYRVASPRPTNSAVESLESKREDSTNTVALKP